MRSFRTIKDWQQSVEAVLQKADVEAAKRTSWDLLCHATGRSKAFLMNATSESLDAAQEKILKKILQARCDRIPLQYILGTEAFWGMTIRVGKGVLIPRPETELLMEVVRKRFPETASECRMVDFCTGSGNIALALAQEYPNARIWGIDKSRRALSWAEKNLRDNPRKNIVFRLGDIESALSRRMDGTFSVVTANPPYVTTAQMADLQDEVRREPRMALHGGPDGLRVVRKAVRMARRLLRPGGLCACEIGIDQSCAVHQIFEQNGFQDIRDRNDWQAIPRIISAVLR